MTTDFSKFEGKEAQELTKPRDKAWDNFGKFKKVGDKFEGVLVDVFFRKAEGKFPEQRGFTLEQKDGKMVNVTIKREPYFAIASTDDIHLGDFMVMELSELREPKEKGNYPAKIYSFKSIKLEENEENPTVEELEREDAEKSGVRLDVRSEDDGADEIGEKQPF